MILVSACLVGENCRWDGSSKLIEGLKSLIDKKLAISVCPELLGGLSVPREPAEIRGGSGEDVMCGRARVIDRLGQDVSVNYINGAYRVLELAKDKNVKKAIFCARSSSCGKGQIYDGSFTGNLKKGNGVAAALLSSRGIEIVTDEAMTLRVLKRGYLRAAKLI
jgi:uncharacterized protein YbbK (DUF523 family)